MKRLLIVVDYQIDFVNGALGFSGAEKIENNIISLINEFESSGDDVVFTMDTHQSNYLETTEGKNLPVPHCIKGTNGWQITPEVNKCVKNHKVFEKGTFPSFELGDYIRQTNPDEIYLCGLVSDICVFSNAIIAKSACSDKAEVKVVRNASDSYDHEMQEKSYDVLKHLHISII